MEKCYLNFANEKKMLIEEKSFEFSGILWNFQGFAFVRENCNNNPFEHVLFMEHAHCPADSPGQIKIKSIGIIHHCLLDYRM